MGVGYPDDLLVSIALGADMFDCVWPTRTARFGNAITSTGTLNLRNSSFARDYQPIDPTCRCPCCLPESEKGGLGTTRAYIYHIANKETVGAHLLTMHNVHFLLNLMKLARQAILKGSYPAFVQEWLAKYYGVDLHGPERWPGWAVDALRAVNVDLLQVT